MADDDDSHATRSRRQTQIVDLWRDLAVVAVIEDAERCLFATATELSSTWLRRRLHTLAQALYSGALSVLSEVPEGDLTVDVIDRSGQVSIVLSETIGGGLGHVEALFTKLSTDPTEFDNAVRAALLQCERATTTGTLLEAVSHSCIGRWGGPLPTAFASVRGARAFNALDAARVTLREALFEAGLDSGREAVTAMMGTILRPGSSAVTYGRIRGLNALWRKKNLARDYHSQQRVCVLDFSHFEI